MDWFRLNNKILEILKIASVRHPFTNWIESFFIVGRAKFSLKLHSHHFPQSMNSSMSYLCIILIETSLPSFFIYLRFIAKSLARMIKIVVSHLKCAALSTLIIQTTHKIRFFCHASALIQSENDQVDRRPKEKLTNDSWNSRNIHEMNVK